jgi:two-component system NtrC family sensor kinase
MPPPDESPAVLYVDDEPINLRVFEANFRTKFRVLTCQSASEALAILGTRAQEIGILISDQRMPNMTGVELLERAREIAPDVQRMVITAYSDMQAVMDAVNRGQVSRYFVKPWVKEELQSSLEASLRIYILQSKLREIESRVLQSERLATIGQVSAGIAHELMNPVSYMSQNIATVRGDLKILAEYLTPCLRERPNSQVERILSDLPQSLDDIETGSKHIRQVALGIRAQARGEDQAESADLAEVAEFASRMAKAEIRQRAKLLVDGNSVMVRGGPVKLCQVLLNLIVNGAQAMDGTGRRGQVEVSWKEKNGQIRLAVTDNGRGIPPELLDKVFKPFFTTKAPGEGTGLGLSISKDLVQGMGGSIELHSTPGVGTTVEVLLQKAS